MGINGLWDVLGEGEIWHIADYAAQHFEKQKRPLRIVVDEACWRFTNLTPEQVEKIREGEPAANPVEKTILWRILRLWRLNIQLLFVWDGMRKPGKGPGRGGRTDRKCVELLHQMFDRLKVPYHQAPGEAEAECARLQQLGVVDAVWADDGDSFMFGCGVLVKQHKVKGKAIKDHIRVYRADDIARKYDFDANSFVLFAVLAGGDYDKAGLPNCGPTRARYIAKRSKGIAQKLVEATRESLPEWRALLANALPSVPIPATFPNMKALDGYRNPAISTDEQCLNLRRLRKGWDIKIDQNRLRNELRELYHFTTREYLKHLAPVFLARALARIESPRQKEENLSYDVKLKPSRVKKSAEDGPPAKSEVKVTFAAPLLVEIDLSTKPPEEDWDKFAGKDGSPYDPTQNIECEILRCFLEHGLPPGSYDAPVKQTKRKLSSRDGAEDSSQTAYGGAEADGNSKTTPKKRKRPAQSNAEPTYDGSDAANSSSRKRGRTANQPGTGTEKSKRRKKTKIVEDKLPASPPPSKFQVLDIGDFDRMPDVIDLGDEDDESEDETSEAGLFVSPASTSASGYKTSIHASQPTTAASPLRLSPSLPSNHRHRSNPERLEHPSVAPKHRATFASKIDPIVTFSTEPREGFVSRGAANSSAPLAASTQKAVAPHTKLFTQDPVDSLVPGEVVDPAELRRLRAVRFLSKTATGAPSVSSPTAAVKPVMMHEVIDLT